LYESVCGAANVKSPIDAVSQLFITMLNGMEHADNKQIKRFTKKQTILCFFNDSQSISNPL